VVDQVAVLEEHAYMTRPKRRALVFAAARQRRSIDAHHAAVGLVETGKACEQRGLSRSGRPGHRDQLTAIDGQRHARSASVSSSPAW